MYMPDAPCMGYVPTFTQSCSCFRANVHRQQFIYGAFEFVYNYSNYQVITI